MSYLVLKYLLTSLIIVAVSEFARRSDRLGAIVGSLPLVTVLTMVWLHIERQPEQKIANHAFYTFWYVLPTMPMFVVFPVLLRKFEFWGALGASVLVTAACFVVLAVFLRRFGIGLM